MVVTVVVAAINKPLIAVTFIVEVAILTAALVEAEVYERFLESTSCDHFESSSSNNNDPYQFFIHEPFL